MSQFNLQKNQKFDLNKNGAPLTLVNIGLGWDPVKSSGGFFRSILGDSVDLDASCILYDANRRVVDTVWFGKLRDDSGAIRHLGDNLTGDGDGDDETITIDLQRVPANVQSLVVTICSFRGQTLEKVERCHVRAVNAATREELAVYTPSAKSSHTALIMAKIVRGGNGAWSLTALGEAANGRTVNDLAQLATQYL